MSPGKEGAKNLTLEKFKKKMKKAKNTKYWYQKWKSFSNSLFFYSEYPRTISKIALNGLKVSL